MLYSCTHTATVGVKGLNVLNMLLKSTSTLTTKPIYSNNVTHCSIDELGHSKTISLRCFYRFVRKQSKERSKLLCCVLFCAKYNLGQVKFYARCEADCVAVCCNALLILYYYFYTTRHRSDIFIMQNSEWRVFS